MMSELSNMVWIRLVPWCLKNQTGNQVIRQEVTSLQDRESLGRTVFFYAPVVRLLFILK